FMVTKTPKTSAGWLIANSAALAIFLGVLSIGVAGAAPKVDPDLQQQFHDLRQAGRNASRVPVIVQFKTAPSDARIAGLAKAHGGGLGLQFVRGGAFKMTPDEVEALANDPDVDYIVPDRPVQSASDYYEVAVGGDW